MNMFSLNSDWTVSDSHNFQNKNVNVVDLTYKPKPNVSQ